MPKVYLNDNERKSARLAKWVYGELKSRRMTQDDLAKELGVTRQAVGVKLRKCQFSYTDFLTIIGLFEPTADELAWLVK